MSPSSQIPEGAIVWIKDTVKDSTDAFVKATVTKFTEGRGYTVKGPDGKEKTVRATDVAMANPDGMSAPDNCYLIHISESTILENMKTRYANKAIYTFTGSILIAVNPFEQLDIYGSDKMLPYPKKPLGIVEPHAYSMAEEAYNTLVKTQLSQSLVVSGESGSGKTETNKHLMQYIAYRSKSESLGNDLAATILATNPILESFGNAKTSRNNNSSRFGKFVKIGMSERGGVLGATTKQYLLEKSRVPFQSEKERNYHVFYLLVVGHKDKAALGLDKGCEHFHYLNQSGVFVAPGKDDAAEYQELLTAMGHVGMPDSDKELVFKLIAGLLHIGNIDFVGDDETASVKPSSSAALAKVCELMSLPNLEKCLLQRSLTTRGETTMINLTPSAATLARDALAKAIYTKLFDYIVDTINTSIKGEMQESSRFIGLLDVYGFESFQVNTFEQLCINFANEKLQQFFLKFIFKAEEDLYRDEAVAWTRIEYQDNQGCIDLIEKSPTGIMRILDETCKKPASAASGGDTGFCSAVADTHKRNDFFMDPRGAGYKNWLTSQAFAVRHFAGDVCYFGEGFCEKNNDTLHTDFTDQMSASPHAVLSKLFKTDGGAKKGNTFNSVSRRFINDLNALMTDLNATKAHFIRCIKPNTSLKPTIFTPTLVLTQLRCSGTIDAVQLMAGAYPTRIPFQSIYDRYATHMPEFVQKLEPDLFCEALALALEIPPKDFQLGRTKIFFKAGKGQVLEELAERDLSEVIPILIEKIKQWEKRKAAQVKLQAHGRRFLYQSKLKRAKRGAKAIAHRYHSQKIFLEYRKRHLLWLAKREREAAERKKREEEEKKRIAEEAQRKAAEEARKAADAIAQAKNAEEKQKAEAAAAIAAAATAKAAQEMEAATEAERAAGFAASHVVTEEEIEAKLEKERQAALAEATKSEAPEAEKDDMIFTVSLSRGAEGLGLDVDHYRKGATIGYVAPDGVAGKDGRLKVGDMIQAVNGTKCGSYDEVINCIRASGQTVELTLIRKHISKLLESTMAMEVGALRQWEEFTFRLYSNRELSFEKTQPPAYTGEIDVRLALEVRMIDAPNGGGFLEIETASKTYVLRSNDQTVLHRWRRELYELLPYLRATEVKCGWLYKRGETSSAGFKKRYCVLFSSYRLLYFDSEACTKRKGAVDLSVAEAVDLVQTSKGHGFEISTPGRTWVFAAEVPDEQLSWSNALKTMLGDIQERKKRQQMQEGVTILKEGWADLKDETQDGEGAWEGHWFALNSSGELRVYPDAESTEEQLVALVDLKHVERVERSKGMDFYDFCIDLIGAEKTTRMRPIDRGDMQAWLGVLQTQLSAFTTRTNKGALITTLHQGWLEKKGEKVALGEGWKKRYFVLSARQEQLGEGLEVQHYLHYFKSEDQAADVSEGGVIDLGDVDEIRKLDGKELHIVTETRLWQLRADSANTQDTWITKLQQVCSGDVNPDTASREARAPPPPADVTTIAAAEMKMQVPAPDGQACWKTAQFELQSDGVLRWKSDEAWPWDAGAIDIKKALGVWLLGPPGWRRLDIILPEHRWTLAADNDEILQTWVKLLEDVAPEKPVSEIRNGWMEKKGNMGGGWKLRFFVLLSTHELLYFESDRSPKCKGVIDLKEASACNRVANPDYNYEFAFEVVAPKRTWVLCPDGELEMKEWMDDIRPLIKGAGGPGATPPASSKKKRKSLSQTQSGARTYEIDEDGSASGQKDGLSGGNQLKKGWLEKRGEVNTAWKNRYFVLTQDKVLRYYKDEESSRTGKYAGVIELNSGNVAVTKGSSMDADHPHYFEVSTLSRTYVLCAPSAEELNEWITALEEAGESSGKMRSESISSVASFIPSGPLVEVHSGWMKKKGSGGTLFGGKMQKRFFVLYDNRELHYFEGTSMDNIQRKGRIRMATATDLMRVKPDDKKDFTFVIKATGRDWILDPGSQAAWEEWQSKLRPMLG